MRGPARLLVTTVAAAMALGCFRAPADPSLETFLGEIEGETGRIALSGPSIELRREPRIKASYLGQ